MSAYRAALRLPGAAAFSAAGALARLPQAMVGLGCVLMLTGLHRSYTLAGLVAGAVSLAQGGASPWLGHLIDRYGQRAVLLPQLTVHVLGLGLLVAVAQRQAPAWLLLGAALVVGVSLPQFGACSRARWTALLGGDPRLHAAMSVESLIDEAVFVVGPVLVTTLATAVAPAAGLLTALGLVLAGGLLFLAQRGTEPAPHPGTAAAPHVAAIRHRGLLVVVAVFVAIGVLFGLVEVGIVALAREHHRPAAAGTMLALWATGSLVCGTVYGARTRWRSSPVRRFQLGAAAMAAGCVLIAASAHSLLLATAALVIGGLANAPTLITGNTLVPAVVPAPAVTEAYTWLGVAVFAGIALGSPLGGALVDHQGAGAALWVAVVAGTAAAAVTVTGRHRLTAPADGH